MELKEGMLAISKAGHDKDCWYVVVKTEGEYAYLADGENRPIQRSKKKKLKHLQGINKVPEILQEKLDKGKNWTDEEIKRALKLAKQD